MYIDEWEICVPHNEAEQLNFKALAEYLDEIYSMNVCYM